MRNDADTHAHDSPRVHTNNTRHALLPARHKPSSMTLTFKVSTHGCDALPTDPTGKLRLKGRLLLSTPPTRNPQQAGLTKPFASETKKRKLMRNVRTTQGERKACSHTARPVGRIPYPPACTSNSCV